MPSVKGRALATLLWLLAGALRAGVPDSPTPTVIPTDTVSLQAEVYNAAGEPVRALYNGGIDAVPASVALDAGTFVEGSVSATVLLAGDLAPTGPIVWDGLTDGADPAAPGSYYITVTTVDGTSQTTQWKLSVVVLAPTPTPSATPTISPTLTVSPTASPTASISPTATRTVTPAFRASGQPRSILGPSPLRGHQPLCLSFAQAPTASHWQVYSLDGAKVAELGFGSQRDQCWEPAGVAEGIYMVHLDITLAGGGHEQRWQKVALLP